MPEIPEKKQYKLSEVCEYTDTQPYVLRFWESEFPQLKPERSRTGQPIYTRGDLETVLRIKKLLQDDQQSIADARELLEREAGDDARASKGRAKGAAKATPVRSKGAERGAKRTGEARPAGVRPRLEPTPARPAVAQESLSFDTVSRERYENAVDEIAHLKLELNDSETQRRRAEQRLKKAEEALAALRERSDRAMRIIEEVAERLGS